MRQTFVMILAATAGSMWLVSHNAHADEPTFSDDEINQKLREDASALDKKLKELFDVPETPAAQSLGITGDAINHPETIKDVSLQILTGLSGATDLSQGLALEFAPFRPLVFKNLSLEDFRKLPDGTLAASSLSISLAALNLPDAPVPGTSYAFGLRLAPLDDADYRRNLRYIEMVTKSLNSCLTTLSTPSPLTASQEQDVTHGIEELDTLLKVWRTAEDARASAENTARAAKEALRTAATVPLSADAATAEAQAAQLNTLRIQREVADDILSEKNAAVDAARTAIVEKLTAIDSIVGERDHMYKGLRAIITRELDPDTSERDENLEQGERDKANRLVNERKAKCKQETTTLAEVDKALVGNRLEISTATVFFDPSKDDAYWSESNLAFAYEYKWKAGFLGFAARGRVYDHAAVKGQVDGGLRGGFDTGNFAGAISAAGGATDLENASFTFKAGAQSSLVVADTFLARIGVLTTYEDEPGFNATAYFSIGTATGEDLFTKVLVQTNPKSPN